MERATKSLKKKSQDGDARDAQKFGLRGKRLFKVIRKALREISETIKNNKKVRQNENRKNQHAERNGLRDERGKTGRKRRLAGGMIEQQRTGAETHGFSGNNISEGDRVDEGDGEENNAGETYRGHIHSSQAGRFNGKGKRWKKDISERGCANGRNTEKNKSQTGRRKRGKNTQGNIRHCKDIRTRTEIRDKRIFRAKKRGVIESKRIMNVITSATNG